MTLWFADTSVVIPAIVSSHEHHDRVNHAIGRRVVRLPWHASLEAYSVLTRLPGDARLSPADAALVLSERFGEAVVLADADAKLLVGQLAQLRIAGGAVYDALIAMTATKAGGTLLTRDRRAASTYEQLKAAHQFVG